MIKLEFAAFAVHLELAIQESADADQQAYKDNWMHYGDLLKALSASGVA